MELTFVNQTTKSISVTGVDVVESLSLLKDDLSVGAEGLVSGQDSCRGHVDLKLTSCKASLKVKLVVQYTLESRALSLPLAIPMPCSSMLTPYKLETDHLASVIASGKCSNLSSSVVRWVALAFLLRVYSCSHFVYLPPFIRNASPAAIQKVFHLLLAASARPSALLKLKTSPTPSLLLQLVSAMMWY
jgi:hypothetical protein